ncbi:intraflagellar transport protein 20 homolog [Diorhabda sublineata]|uniref:intraflagellar transport protein 20 homolog n=1 Tax=Diorhabda sublineata TaxID=1163346 RepID=UPI0024E11A56|nr:intraflagellar transport protein 20 homolog [Diorhabda sublineata]
MTDLLAKSGIFFDEVDRICILEPEVSKSTHELKDECQLYTEKIEEFQRLSKKYVDLVQQLGDTIEKEKMKAIGARNILHSMEKQREHNQEQLQAMVSEKTMELERLKIQLTSLQKTEMEQLEIINQLTHC